MITDIQTAFTTASPGAYVTTDNGVIKLAVDRRTYGYTEFTFTSDMAFSTRPYLLLKYSTKGLQYNADPHAPFLSAKVAAGETFTCSEATITAHDGDWRKAFAIYKKWVDSWYTPHERAQNKEWYRKDFWLLAEIPHFFETMEFTDMPPWYDNEKKRMKFRDILEEHKSVTGCYPDILHMWGWTYDKELGSMKWGNWSDEDYEIYGGKEAFREALHDVQDNMAYKLKKKYAHCFASDYPETMIASPSEAICANKFPAESETLYTLYNRAYSTYRGPLLAVPHMDGQTYYDAWNDKVLEPEIRDGFAILSGQLDAQQIGCIVVQK